MTRAAIAWVVATGAASCLGAAAARAQAPAACDSTIVGRVFDMATREPVAGTTVELRSDPGNLALDSTRTGAGGTYCLSAPPTGPFRLWFSRDGRTIVRTPAITLAAGARDERSIGIPSSAAAAAGAAPEPAYFEFEVEVPAQPLNPMSHPAYPAAEREQRVKGDVLVQFVVDTLGVPELATFVPLRATSPVFARAVFDWLQAARYRPATVGGRRVRQLVQQAFTFASVP